MNSKLAPINFEEKTHYKINITINKDLSFYIVYIFDLFHISSHYNNNNLINTQNNQNQDVDDIILPKKVCEFGVSLKYIDENQRKKRSEILSKKNNYEKYKIGHVLLWEKDYLIIATPFNSLHIIDFKGNKNTLIKPIGYINNEIDDDNDMIIIYNISEKIEIPQYGSCFIMRDNKGKIQLIRSSNMKERMLYNTKKEYINFDDLSVNEKLSRIKYSWKFFVIYYILFLFFPLLGALIGHFYDDEEKLKEAEKTALKFVLGFFGFYIVIGFFYKSCIFNIDSRNVSLVRCILFLAIIIKFCGMFAVFFLLCILNKTVVVFLASLNFFYIAHILFYNIVYCCKIKYLLKVYLLGFIFYQISRLSIIIIIFFITISNATNLEIYIYIIILCFISGYMYFVNYFYTMQENLSYRNKYQALLNYPFEWLNLIFYICSKNNGPLECVKKLEENCGKPCDEKCIEKFPNHGIQSDENKCCCKKPFCCCWNCCIVNNCSD